MKTETKSCFGEIWPRGVAEIGGKMIPAAVTNPGGQDRRRVRFSSEAAQPYFWRKPLISNVFHRVDPFENGIFIPVDDVDTF